MQKISLISIVIPSRDASRKENIAKLLDDISKQKIEADVEICQIQGVSPSGKARNMAAEKAKGNILVFVDDDIRIPDEQALACLIQPLLEDDSIGISFCSLSIPPDSSAFQIRYAKEIPRSEIPVVDKLTDAGAMSTHLCAIRKDLFFKMGGFNEQLKRGEDPEFSYRLKNAGYRLVLVAKTWCYHPVPKNIPEVIRLNFRNGQSSAFADRYYPQLNIDVNPKSIIYPTQIRSKIYRIRRFVLQFFSSIFTAKLLLMLSKITYAFGYLSGLMK